MSKVRGYTRRGKGGKQIRVRAHGRKSRKRVSTKRGRGPAVRISRQMVNQEKKARLGHRRDTNRPKRKSRFQQGEIVIGGPHDTILKASRRFAGK